MKIIFLLPILQKYNIFLNYVEFSFLLAFFLNQFFFAKPDFTCFLLKMSN